MPRVTGLFIYPVKSLRGCAVTAAEIDDAGFVGDRRFLVVDGTGKFLTQRTLPRMARIATRLESGVLTLSSDGAGRVSVATASDPAAPLRTVNVWKSEGLLAEDCGAKAAAWLSGLLGTECRLVRAGARFHRPVLKAAGRPGDRFSFADAVPFLVLGEATLADLNDRLVARGEEAVPMDRFRPNLVVAGSAPFAEDTWPRLLIRPASVGVAAPPTHSVPGESSPPPSGGIVFRSAGPCSRCIVTTTDQLTGDRPGPEPLRTLATYRRDRHDPTDVNFGQNLIHETKAGTIRIGDEVEPLAD